MGSLVLQIGQCGNQVGLKLWDELRSMHHSNNDFLFRDGENVAHSIMIDTEPKVLRSIKQERGTYFYIDPNNVLYYQHGRGNNWAMGYNNVKSARKIGGDMDYTQKFDNLSTLEKAQMFYKQKTSQKNKASPEKEPDNDEATMRENSILLEQANTLIQKELEKIDYYTSTMLIYSLAGGTGSGFGSRILETLRDEYSANLLYNTVVFPSASGENPLQQYNCLLSLSHLQDFSDGIIYFQNDRVYRCLSRMGVTENTKPVNIDDINDYIGNLLANLLKINDLKTPKRFYTDYLSDLTCLNECKFIEMFGSPFNLRGSSSLGPEPTWEHVIDQSFMQTTLDIDQSELKPQMQPMLTNNNSLAVKCILRSIDVDTTYLKSDTTKKHMDKKIQSCLHPLKWNPDAVTFEIIKEKIKPMLDVKNMLVLANRVHIAGILKELSDVSRAKYKARAYLHWYFKYGMEEEDFMQAFENIETIIDNYKFLLN